jgi:Fungal Zn(2)-Cys(6) binuclear cluster domain
MSNAFDIEQIPIRGDLNSGHDPARLLQQFSSGNENAYLLGATARGGATQAPSSTTSAYSPPHRIRRRNRMITSCLECRRRKLKCDKLHPCTNCAKFVRDCVFLAPALDSASQLKMTEIKEKMGVLERGLEVEVATAKKQPRLRQHGRNISGEHETKQENALPTRTGTVDLPGELPEEESEEEGAADMPEDEKGLVPTPLAVVDAAYDDDADDDMLDLGVKMGKMRYEWKIQPAEAHNAKLI